MSTDAKVNKQSLRWATRPCRTAMLRQKPRDRRPTQDRHGEEEAWWTFWPFEGRWPAPRWLSSQVGLRFLWTAPPSAHRPTAPTAPGNRWFFCLGRSNNVCFCYGNKPSDATKKYLWCSRRAVGIKGAWTWPHVLDAVSRLPETTAITRKRAR